jgi:uncharacterized MAPEG superfamily protein
MTPTAAALLGYCAWMLTLLVGLAVYRTSLVTAGKKASNAFSTGGEDLEGFGRRLTRAHANCYENLPLAGAVMLYAIATGSTALTDPLAYPFLGLRILQSGVHLVSTSRPAVLVRFLLFVGQTAILIFWLLRLFKVL